VSAASKESRPTPVGVTDTLPCQPPHRSQTLAQARNDALGVTDVAYTGELDEPLPTTA
jgi:hypothetical protein